jgi:hypothetical protein
LPPVSRIIGVVVTLVVIAALTIFSLSQHARAARSSYIQDHGLRRTGVVASVKPVDHSARYDSWTTYDYGVTLDGSAVVAHDPAKNVQRFGPGEPIKVLVDPRHPSYAELPGKPVQSSSWFVPPLILGLVFAGLAVLIAYKGAQRRRAGEQQPAAAPADEAPVAPEQLVRSLRDAGRLAEATAHVDELGPYGVADDDFDTSLGAAVFEAYGDELAATDRAAADEAYRRAAELQRAFASCATSGGEGIARSEIADQMDAKRGGS